MIDFIKFFPLKLRQPARDEDIKGPSFRSAKEITLRAAGNTLRLRAPRHRPHFESSPVYLKHQDGLEGPFRLFTHGAVANDSGEYSTLLQRSWSYWYGWFGGHKGELYCHVSIMKRTDKNVFKEFSFFHPRGFEYAITNYLNTRYGHEESNGKPRYQAPVNWHTHEQLPVFSVSFDVKPTNESRLFVFPITHSHFIKMEFGYVGIGEKLRHEMETLVNHIINSVTLELGPESQTQWNEIKAQCQAQSLDMSLTKKFPPLKWPIKREDIENVPTINLEPPTPALFR